MLSRFVSRSISPTQDVSATVNQKPGDNCLRNLRWATWVVQRENQDRANATFFATMMKCACSEECTCGTFEMPVEGGEFHLAWLPSILHRGR